MDYVIYIQYNHSNLIFKNKLKHQYQTNYDDKKIQRYFLRFRPNTLGFQ